MPSMTTVEGACLMEMREATVVRSGSRNRTIAASNVFSTRPLACTRLIATAVIQCHLPAARRNIPPCERFTKLRRRVTPTP
jgi:hypothetical protein